MKKLCKVYEAVNRDGEVVARGFAQDVASVLGCAKQNVISLSKNEGVFKGKYKISVIGQKFKYYTKDGQVTGYSNMLPKEETFVERYQDLAINGKTIMTREEFKRHKQLIEGRGYKAKYKRKRHGREEAYYIVEVVNGL